MVVWVYAGGGQAEIGIIPWLQRHFHGVSFERRLPQIRKPGPRPGMPLKHTVVGQTGAGLNVSIRQNLKNYWQTGAANVLLLLDDTDCEQPEARRQSLLQVVSETIVEDSGPCVVIALAVPELEVWLLADWQNTFEKNYHRCHIPMRNKLSEDGVDFDSLEDFDCRCGTSEYRKISESIRNAFALCCATSPGYSKDTDTRRLLQADPEKIAQRCPNFKAFWNDLKKCIETTQ